MTVNPPGSGKPVFFIDRAIECRQLIRELREAGAQIRRHMDEFVHSENDENWLPVVGQRKWFLLTRDQQIRYEEVELQALRSANVGAFILVSGELSGRQFTRIVMDAWPTIEEAALNTPTPFIFKVYRDGTIMRQI